MDYYEDGVKAGNAGFVKWTKLHNGREQLQLQITYYPVQAASCERVMLCMDQGRINLGSIEIQGRKGTLLVDDLEVVIKSAGLPCGQDAEMKSAGISCNQHSEMIGGGISCEHHSEMEIRIEIDPHRVLAASFVPEGQEEMVQEMRSEMGQNMRSGMGQKTRTEMGQNMRSEARTESLEPGVIKMPQQAEQERFDSQTQQQSMPESAIPQTITEIIVEETGKTLKDNTEKVREQRQVALLQTRRMMRMHRDKWQQLWESFPHIRPFQDEREYLQLTLQDLIVLPKSSYSMAENSFLLHGYYNYEHLILTKLYKRGTEKYYIGVPGNYYVKEAQMAVLFGFESFEPRIEPAKEGDFGYYMIGVEI